MTPERIAHYRVVAPLGEGGMGAVYRAYDDRLDREVAIKLLKPTSDPLATERFFREARAASALNHPNIVTVYEVGEAEHGHFIVMELVRGRGLRLLIGQEIEEKKFLSLARQTAEALSVAHAAGIVHRDVKPENIMVRDDGYVKVLDFGLARLTKQPHPTATMDTVIDGGATREIVGTVKYMSPEQAVGQSTDRASDVFSLGVVLYELATGWHPFESGSPFGVLHGIITHPPVAPSRLNVGMSKDCERLIVSMLEKDPSRRPTAADVAAAIADLTPTPRPASTTGSTRSSRPFVGRMKARSELREALSHVESGSGLLMCVSGESGIGKTALVEDFLTEVCRAGRAGHVARGRCSERLAGAEGYLPLLDALEDLLRSDDGLLARLMRTVAPLWYRQVAPAALQDQSSAQLLNEGGTQERLKRELAAFFAEASRSRPFILFLDDVQWVDLSTVDVLTYVGGHFHALPMLVIATYRPEELLVQRHPFLSTKRELQSRSLCRETSLDFLAREEIEEYIGLIFPNHRLPRSFVDLIYAKTEGNALFVVDVLRYLVDHGVLTRDDEGCTLTQSISDLAAHLPESVRGLIQRKIDALGEEDRRLLLAAGVQGYEFDGAVVARVLGIDPADCEDKLDAIDRLHGLVRRLREQEFPDATLTIRYRFVHVLYQHMLYGSLTPARKASLSRSVGKALEEFYQRKTAEIAPALGILYEGAREFSLAADYFHAASKKAARVFACEEAVVVGRRALDNLRALPETAERDRRELAILMTMSVPASASRGFSSPEVQRVYDRASELCLAFNETDQLVRVLYGLIQFHTVRLQLESVEEAAERIDHLARNSPERIVAVYNVTGLGLSNYYRGNFEQAMAHFRRAAEACSLEVRRSICATVGYDPTSASSVYVAWCLWWLGHPDRALQELDVAIESAGEVSFRFSLANALTFACALYHWYGDWDRARMYNERARTLSGDEGFSYFVATSICFEGLWMARHGQRDEGLTRMQEGLDSLRVIEGRASLRRYTTEFAEELAAAGRVDEGLDLIAAEIASMRSDRFWEAELLRVNGELRRRRGEAAEAERSFERAIDAARRQRAKSFELRATLSLARLWREQGKPAEAISRLSEICHWFPEGSETADLREARRLLIPDLRTKN